MTDIIERLRSSSPYLHGSSAERMMAEAADEIERLTMDNKQLRDDFWKERERVDLLRAEIERLTEAHERIVEWSRAYPLTIFPKPDLKKARELLEAGGMTLDAISADAMRHVIESVGKISRAALEPKP